MKKTKKTETCNEQTKTYSPVAPALYLSVCTEHTARVCVGAFVKVQRDDASNARKSSWPSHIISFLNVCSVDPWNRPLHSPHEHLFVLNNLQKHMRLPLQRLGHTRHVRIL